jgi:uncharacterized protein (TIGR04255 family)
MATAADFFPVSVRVLFGRNPLYEVICQVRYPTILKIEGETPSDFQEKIRHRFPGVERMKNPLEGKVPPEILKVLGRPMGANSYGFTTEDGSTKITLAGDALAVVTSSYKEWADFKADINLALGSLAEVYVPSSYSRVGLRYQNILKRSIVGPDARWADLIRAELAGELVLGQWDAAVQTVQKAIQCKINEGDAFTLQHGLTEVEGSDEAAYLLDFDYFNETRTEITNVDAALDRLHGHSGNAFRWAISEALHQAMEPQQG